MKIIIANQKGGVGKTTHCILFSNFLTSKMGQEILILDMDFQSSIKTMWDEDKERYENRSLYEVIDLGLDSFSQIKDKLASVDGHVIIDLPGKIDDDNLIAVFKSVDLVICPFSYDKITVESTLIFAQVVKHVNPSLQIVFIPNRLKPNVKYELMQQVNNLLNGFGTIAPKVSDRIAFQRINTVSTAPEIVPQTEETYGYIFDNFFN
ncbi:ParA family protein [Chondrinema litorale]|uniref:ParA family protein n=1 Tax=Chondrinema litorale TaxID=2994555 RepID=UPI002543C94B|nr:ParA family protein [Chondrinema litorale]UZR99634.1 ParA family protein [Chondrinema litorale]